MRSRRKQVHHSKGFSIVEVVVAMVIVIVIIIVTGGMVRVVSRAVDDASYVSISATTAQSQVDLLRNKPYASIATGTTDFTALLPSRLPKPASGVMTVTEVRAGLKRVRLVVSYGGSSQTYVTLIRGNDGI